MRYEYNLNPYGRTVSKLDLRNKFNNLGAEGWDLVAVYDVEVKGVGFLTATPKPTKSSRFSNGTTPEQSESCLFFSGLKLFFEFNV